MGGEEINTAHVDLTSSRLFSPIIGLEKSREVMPTREATINVSLSLLLVASLPGKQLMD